MAEKRIRFTFVDCLIVFVLLAILAGGWLFLTKGLGGNRDLIKYELYINNLKPEVAENIKVGDVIFDSAQKMEIGTVTKVEKKPFVDQVFDSIQGTFSYQPVPDRYEVHIFAQEKGSFGDEKIEVNGYEIYVGKTVYVKSESFVCAATVWGVEKGEESDAKSEV